METSIGSQLFDKGWKQGAYIECSDLSDILRDHCWASSQSLNHSLNKELTEKRNILILLSQACDIAAFCDNNEPMLEFVIARRPKKHKVPHSLNQNAHSSRYLELKINNYWYKAEALKIIQISKAKVFEEGDRLQPACLSELDVEILARWRANRYMRVGLPNAFNNKIKPLIQQGIFDIGLEHAGGLYINLDPFEESNEYLVRLFAMQRQNSSEDTFNSLYEKMFSILEALNLIDGLICPFIEGESTEVFEEIMPAMRRHEITIALRDHFVRWNFDYLSLKAGDSSGIDES